MANYLTTSDINGYLGTSGEDTLINVLNGIATSRVNSFLGVDTLLLVTYTNEEYDLFGNNASFYNPNDYVNSNIEANYIYHLKQINPTSVTHINGVAVGNYKLNGRRLQLQYAPENTETIFNKVKITYVAGFTTIPDDIKAVIYELVGFMYNNKKSQGINSFTQGQLTVDYGNNSKNNEVMNNILYGLKKYKINTILS